MSDRRKDANPFRLRGGIWSRRSFLRTTLTGFAMGGIGLGRASLADALSGARAVPAWLLMTVGDLRAAERIGRAYLDNHPLEQSRDILLQAINRALQPMLVSITATRPDDAQAVAALQRVVPDEYRRGKVVMVDSWILSRTEARVYAMVTTYLTDGHGAF